jgi:hypothetical protein
MSTLCLVLVHMATHRRAARRISLLLHASSEQLSKKVLESHLRREWNQLHASPTARSGSEKDSDSKMAQFVSFEGVCALGQPKLGPQAARASEQSSSVNLENFTARDIDRANPTVFASPPIMPSLNHESNSRLSTNQSCRGSSSRTH